MPREINTPGVFIEEIPKLPPVVVGVDTDVAAFLGYTEKAEDPETNTALDGAPFLVASMLDYERAFGGAWEGQGQGPLLHDSIALFYANGGGKAWITSAGDFAAFEADMAKGALEPSALRSALDRIRKVDDPALLAAPESALMSADDFYAFAAAMLEQASSLRDRFAIVDLPGDPAEGISAAVDPFRRAIGPVGKARAFGAAYFPALLVASGADTRAVPPSGAVAGAIVANDQSRGVWKAPANIALAGIDGLALAIDSGAAGGLNVSADGVSINVIRDFPGKGELIWGARTLDGNDNEYRYVPVRRFFIFVERSIEKALQPFAFEPNDAATWVRARGMIENFLTGLWRDGALMGSTPKDAFFVSVGLGSTMTAEDILNGRMNVTVGMAPVRPAEFIVLSLSQIMAPPD